MIDFGEPQTRIIGGQNAFRVDVRREREQLESLKILPTLAVGQTLVITADTQPKGLGSFFFADRFEAAEDGLLLLIRLAETRHDELFSPVRGHQSLVSPLE